MSRRYAVLKATELGRLLRLNFQNLASYNQMANARIYDACAKLSDEERKRDVQAFFGGIHGTLNHLIVADRIWMSRFEGKPITNLHLDDILYEDFDLLRQARQAEDDRIKAFTNNMTEEFLFGTLVTVNSAGKKNVDACMTLLTHFFNHQTHHRGQVHHMLGQAGIDTPVLDLHVIMRG